MIAWKAQYGLWNSNTKSFEVTDNSIIALPQRLDLPVDTSNFWWSNRVSSYSHSGNPLSLASMFNSAMGDDYFVIYPGPSTELRTYGASNLTSVFSSAELAAPNLYDRIRNNQINGKRPGVYIAGLDRYIVFVGLLSGTFRNAVLDGNGNVIADAVQFGLSSTDGSCVSQIVYVGDAISQEQLSNPSNYKILVCLVLYPGQESRYMVSSVTSTNSEALSFLTSLFSSYSPPDANLPVNPYEPVDPSGPGDIPPGTFDDTSDPIPWSSLPTLSAADTGFTRIYNPTLSQVQDLARYLWTEDNLIGTLWNKIKQFFEDPMQSFIAFNLVPCPVPDGGIEEFQLLFIPTGVNLTTAANQFVDVDCGTCEIQRYYGSALDQTPYTKISCFLPYIGMVALDTDEVMGTTLQVKYRIDIVSGSCVAGILVDGNLLYQYSGHCAITIPFASADFSRYVQAAISVAGKLAGAVAPIAGNAIMGAAVADAEQQTDYVVTKSYDRVDTVRNPETGRQITASATHTTTRTVYPAEQSNTKASFNGISPANISNTVGEVMSSKAAIQHSGSFSGNSGYLGLRRPYLLITRPRMCLPENYQSLNGYPSMITMTLGECQGFTRVQQVQLTGMHATNPEQAEILELLKTGVVF